MAFDMTKKPEGKGKSKIIPENIIADEAQHYAVFAEYVELGEHEQKNDKFPDKKPCQEACIGFELTDQTFMRKDKEGNEVETPLLLNRTVALFTSEKSNCYKFFNAIGVCLSEETITKLLDAKVSPKEQQGAAKIGEGATTFLDLLGANCFLSVTHGKSKREFKDCYPLGTTREQAEAEGNKLQTIPVQTVDWVWNNFVPASISPTFHPKYGYEKCERHPGSKGNRVFIFDSPTKESWEALDIWQKEKIMSALNYKGSAVEALVLSLKTKGDDSEATPAKAASKGKGKSATESMDDIPF